MSENQNKTMSELFEDYGVTKLRTNERVKGEVIAVTPEAISVNLRYKSDGILTRDEYSYEFVEDLTKVVKEGDEIEAVVLKLNDQDGNVLLSRKVLEEEKLWEELEALKENKTVVETKIVEATENGVFGIVKGIKGFIPKAHISFKRDVDPSEFVGSVLKVQVLDTKNKKGRNQLFLTAREAAKIEKKEKEDAAWNTIVEGEIYNGVVKNIQEYGAFVDVNGVDGLLHVNEISWNRIKSPAEVLKVGDKISVKVKSIDVDNRKLSLSYKATIQSPWSLFTEKYNVGDVITGKVVRVADFGAFVSLDDVDCLLHIKDLSWTRTEKVTDVVNVGDDVTAKILAINKKDKRVSLGMKQLVEHPFDVATKNFNVGDIIQVEVKRILLEGVYVKVADDIESFIPIAKVAAEKLNTPAQVVKIGDIKDAKITHIDRNGKKIDLSFILEDKENDEEIPSSYSTHSDEEQGFTIGDQLKGLGDLLNNSEEN